jgi:threonine/homoserine/homoserine lactone efflux protein
MFPQVATLLGILTVGLVSPGPDFFLVLKNSMSGSRSRAFATGIGIAVGLTLQVVALSLGLAVAPPVVLRCIQLAGAGVLIWLGTRALLSRPAKPPAAADADGATTAAAGGAGEIRGLTQGQALRARGQAMAGFMEGFLCNATNVKVFIFFVSIFSQFLRAGASWQWRVAVPVIVVLHGAVMWSLITAALLSPPVASRLARAQRWLPRVFGVVLVGFAGFVIWAAVRGAW